MNAPPKRPRKPRNCKETACPMFTVQAGCFGICGFLAAAAIQLLMILLRALKTVCFAGDGNTPHFANINQRIQVAVNGAKAQPRAHCPQRRTDLLRGWIIAARKYLPQNQFTLMRIAHTKNLLLIQCRGKNSKYFPLYIVYMIPVPYHIK